MLKALTAAAAITICCLGNEYPAKACYSCDAKDEFYEKWQQRKMIRQEMEIQQRKLQQQQRYGSWN